MDQVTPFNLALAPDLPPHEREHLLSTLAMLTSVQTSTYRSIDPEQIKAVWEVFVVIMKDTGTILTAGVAAVELANQINTWRREAKQRHIIPKAQLQRPNQPPLDLTNATDKEVLAWLLQNENFTNPKSRNNPQK